MGRFLLLFICLVIFLNVSKIAKGKVINTQTVSGNKILTVHVGSYSQDYHNLTQDQINSLINVISTSVPNANYIAISTYLDYSNQIEMWASAIHKKHKHLFLRSAGFNAWQGTNGVGALMSPIDYQTSTEAFLRLHGAIIFRDGDIFESVPDEPENGSYWYSIYGQSGVGTNQQSIDEFNNFIQYSIKSTSNILVNELHLKIDTGYIFTNPSVSRDIINNSTASLLKTIGTDNYPEVNASSSAEMAQSMQGEITTWLLPAQMGKSKHITFGPSIYFDLDEQTQADAYQQELTVIRSSLPNLNGITIWQSGAPYNPRGRIFDYINGNWRARKAVNVINNFFSSL